MSNVSSVSSQLSNSVAGNVPQPPASKTNTIFVHREERVSTLPANIIFVFGSNLRGAHGASAALDAKNNFGAQIGRGVGPYGQSYAIPTKDSNILTMKILEIQPFVDQFIEYAEAWQKIDPTKLFYLTRVGCGLANLNEDDVISLFSYVPNIIYPDNWAEKIFPNATNIYKNYGYLLGENPKPFNFNKVIAQGTIIVPGLTTKKES
jgi:hypothetical protein